MSNLIRDIGLAATGFVPTAVGLHRENVRREENQQQLNMARERLDMDRQQHQSNLGLTRIRTQAAQQELNDDNQFRQYLDDWKAARQRISAGDFADFISGLHEYNANQGWAENGMKLRGRAAPDGKSSILDHLDESGKVIESSPPLTRAEVLRLYDMGQEQRLKFLNPGMYQRFTAAVQTARERDLDRQSRERIATGHDDARVESTNTRADAQKAVADIRAKAAGLIAGNRSKSLTSAQQRSNLEIDAARKVLAGLTAEEIRQRTSPTTATGRENPHWDSNLARQARLAGRRKIGDDPEFDQRGDEPPSGNAGTGNELDSAFANDPQMRGMRLGKQTDRGREVLNANGKLVGHYGESR